jgi:hypothetical protein
MIALHLCKPVMHDPAGLQNRSQTDWCDFRQDE